MDKIQLIIESNENEELLNYLYELTVKYVQNRGFKMQVLNYILSNYKKKKLEANEYINFCQCSYLLNEFELIATTLTTLIQSEKQK